MEHETAAGVESARRHPPQVDTRAELNAQEDRGDTLGRLLPLLEQSARQLAEEAARLDETLQPVSRSEPVDLVRVAMPKVTESASPVVRSLAEILDVLENTGARLQEIRAKVDVRLG